MPRVYVYEGPDESIAWTYAYPTLIHGEAKGCAFTTALRANLHTPNRRIARVAKKNAAKKAAG